jgi:hypothetical protein
MDFLGIMDKNGIENGRTAMVSPATTTFQASLPCCVQVWDFVCP